MTLDPTLRYTDYEAQHLLAELFPGGWAGSDVMEELVPDGWEASPLVGIFHPTPEQQYEEAVRMHENIQQLARDRDKARRRDEAEEVEPDAEKPESEPPSLAQIIAEHKPTPPEPEKEVRELVGRALWDVFSDNHEVSGPDGRVVDIGSFRGAGGFLAELANLQIGLEAGVAEQREMERFKKLAELGPSFSTEDLFSMLAEREEADRPYDYMDFYMGTQMVAGRADLTPVYAMIFRRLRQSDCDWKYTYPRLYLVNLRSLKKQLDEASQDEEDAEPDWADYDPSAAFAEEREEDERIEEVESMREELDESYRESVESAQDGPPPTTVAAYRMVFGEFPEGWPPEVEE